MIAYRLVMVDNQLCRQYCSICSTRSNGTTADIIPTKQESTLIYTGRLPSLTHTSALWHRLCCRTRSLLWKKPCLGRKQIIQVVLFVRVDYTTTNMRDVNTDTVFISHFQLPLYNGASTSLAPPAVRKKCRVTYRLYQYPKPIYKKKDKYMSANRTLLCICTRKFENSMQFLYIVRSESSRHPHLAPTI